MEVVFNVNIISLCSIVAFGIRLDLEDILTAISHKAFMLVDRTLHDKSLIF